MRGNHRDARIMGSPWASEQILVHELPFAPGPTCPGSTPRGRDSPGHWPARGRPGVGTHLGSPWPRYDIHYESPGVPDPPPHQGFRDGHINVWYSNYPGSYPENEMGVTNFSIGANVHQSTLDRYAQTSGPVVARIYADECPYTLQPHHPHHQSTRSAWTAIGHCSHLRPWQTTFRRQIRRIHTHILETFTGCQTGSLGPNTLARTSTALFTRRCTTPLHLLNLSHLPTTHHHPHHRRHRRHHRPD